MILGICDLPDTLKVMRVINIVITIIRVIVPIILIVSTMIDLVRAVSNSELNKITKPMVNKIIAAILVFLIPTFVKVIANIAGNDGEYEACLGDITPEVINNAYNNQEESLVVKAEESLNINDYNTAISYLHNIEDNEKRNSFSNRLNEVKKKIDEKNNDNKPSMSGTVKATEKGEYTFDGDRTQNIKMNVLNGEYIVAKSEAELNSYVNYIASKKLYQASDEKYSDACLGFAYMHAWGYYKNRRNYTADDGGNYRSGGSFVTVQDENLSLIMNIIYNEILNGRPVVLQVNGNKAGTVRHFVTVVGFKSSVKSGNALTQKDLLIIDSYDGKLERMDTKTSRFLTTGKSCNKKDYQGYYLLYIKHEASSNNNSSSSNNNNNSVGPNNESKSDTPGTYKCVDDPADKDWYHCFKASHDLVIPELGPEGSTIKMKVGETRSFQVSLPSECGSLVKYTRTVADGGDNWRELVTQSRTNLTNTGFVWVVTAKKAGSTTVSQTILYDTTSPSGKCTLNAKSMYKFNIDITK